VLEHDDWALITHLTSPGRQPEMNRSSRMTWLDTEGTTCRVEFVADRWQLSRYSPASETWRRVGSYPTRKAAISAAYGEENQH
jgi:hypothetical protein